MHHTRAAKRSIVALSALLLLSHSQLTQADLNDDIDFNIVPQPLDSALLQFSEQAKIQMVVAAESLKGIETQGITGSMSAETALITLLNETGLEFSTVGSTVTVTNGTASEGQDSGKHQPASNQTLIAQAETSAQSSRTTASSTMRRNNDIGNDRNVLEEIVVTARKRTERLQDIPMSISVLSNFELERMGATEFFDVAVSIPNLSFAYTGLGFNDARGLTIRGIVGQGTTGFYIDDLPIPESMDPRILDVERIEVLRGPQGTLYGARSMGGTVRILTKQADPGEFYGDTRVSPSSTKEGGYNYSLNGALNIPVVQDKVGLRVSAFYEDKEGFLDRVIDDPAVPGIQATQENINATEAWGGQVALRFDVSDKLTILPQVWYQKLEHDGLPFADFSADNIDQVRGVGLPENGEDEWTNLSLTVNYDTSFGTFVSATSLFHRETLEREDTSEVVDFLFFAPLGISVMLPSHTVRTTELDIFVQEARFSSAFEGPLQFTGGVFYQDSKKDFDFPPGFVPGLDATFAGILGVPSVFGTDLLYEQDGRQETSELGIFGELDYAVNDRLTLTAGLRWSDTEIDTSLVTDGIAAGPPLSGTQTEDGFTAKFGIAYDVTDDLLIYANAAEGFRMGGVNLPLPSLCDQDLVDMGLANMDLTTYDTDDLWNYEAGFKASLLGGRIMASATGFFIDWSDIQQSIALPCGFSITANAGEAESKGVELELAVRPMEGLNLSLGAGYTDAKITDPGPNPTIEKGSRVFQVPEWTITAVGDYSFSITERWEGFVRADYRYVDDSFSANQDPTNPRHRPAYNITNFRAGVTTESTFGATEVQWDAVLFIKNAFDEAANLADNRSLALEDPRRPRIVVNQPRTIGIEVRARF